MFRRGAILLQWMLCLWMLCLWIPVTWRPCPAACLATFPLGPNRSQPVPAVGQTTWPCQSLTRGFLNCSHLPIIMKEGRGGRVEPGQCLGLDLLPELTLCFFWTADSSKPRQRLDAGLCPGVPRADACLHKLSKGICTILSKGLCTSVSLPIYPGSCSD